MSKTYDCGRFGDLTVREIAAIAGITSDGVRDRIRAGYVGAQLCGDHCEGSVNQRMRHHLGYLVEPETGLVFSPFRPRTPIAKRTGFGYVQITRNGAHIDMAHRVVWEAVHGLIPKGMEINHINGIKHDNRLANLEVVTPGDNQRHAYRIGLKCAKGDKNGRHIGKLRKAARSES